MPYKLSACYPAYDVVDIADATGYGEPFPADKLDSLARIFRLLAATLENLSMPSDTTMTLEQIRALVLKEYSHRYPEWRDITVADIVQDTFGGHLAVVRATTETGSNNEEICFVYPEATVRIFLTTEELARFLEIKAKAPIIERMFTRPVLSGTVLLGLLVFVFVTGFFEKFNPQALAILGSVLGLSAGYFFGKSPKGS